VTKGKYVDKQKIAPGHYGVPQDEDEIQDLGASIDVIPFAVRDKALDTTEDPPVCVYDATDEVFEDIVERSGEKDSGCMWGPSFLIYERNTGRFYEFFLGSKSARREAGKFGPFLPVSEQQAKAFNMKAQPPKAMTLRSKYIERGKYAWHIPVISQCSTPFDNLPSIELINSEIEKFLNPKEGNVEMAGEGGRDR